MQGNHQNRPMLAFATVVFAGGLLVTGVNGETDASQTLMAPELPGASTPARVLQSIGVPVSARSEVVLIASEIFTHADAYEVLADGRSIACFVELRSLHRAALAMNAFEKRDEVGRPIASVTFSAELCAANLIYGRRSTSVLCVLSTFVSQPHDPDHAWSTVTTMTILGDANDPLSASALVAQVEGLLATGAPTPSEEDPAQNERGHTAGGQRHTGIGDTLEGGNIGISQPLCTSPCEANRFGTLQACGVWFGLVVESIFAQPIGTDSRGCLALCEQDGRSFEHCLEGCILQYASDLGPSMRATLEGLTECHAQADAGFTECVAIWCGTP